MNISSPIMIDALQCSNWDRELFEELRAGGVGCVHVTCAVWENARETLSQLTRWYRWLRENDDILLPVTRGEDIAEALSRGRTGVILGFQNSSPIEDDLSLVEVFHRLDVRVMQLTYNNQSLLGSSCYEQVDAGLSRFGREVIKEMNRLGMIVDLSHVGEQTTLDAIEFSQRPVAVTHSDPKFQLDVKRNKSNRVLEALADRNGVLGCSLYPHFLGAEHITLDEFCQMIARTVDLMGIDHVGIGSDAVRKCTPEYLNWLRMGRWASEPDYGPGSADKPGWPEWPAWFKTPADFPKLASALLDVGFSPEERDKIMGGNWFRFFSEGFEPNG